MKQPFEVQVTVTKTHSFLIEANTSEEACLIAEQYIEDGEKGVERLDAIESADAIPVEEGGDGDLLPVDLDGEAA